MALAPAALTLGSPVSHTRFGDMGLTAQATRCLGPARLASGGRSPERAGLRLGSLHSLGHQHNSAPRDARPACGKRAQRGSSGEGLARTRGSGVAEGEPPRGLGGPGSPRSGEHSWVAQGALEGALQRRGGHRGNPGHQHEGKKRNTQQSSMGSSQRKGTVTACSVTGWSQTNTRHPLPDSPQTGTGI